MKKLFILLVLVLLLIPASAFAQDGGGEGESSDNRLSYGDTVEGSITNQNFEDIYRFEGSRGDKVVIYHASSDGNLDAYLYLTSPDNDILAQNDDFIGLNAGIIFELPNDGEYLIVATRLSGRGGSSSGEYQLTLDLVRPMPLDTTIEGTEVYTYSNNTLSSAGLMIFEAENTGEYEFTYNHIRGEYFPAVFIYALDNNYGGRTDMALMAANRMQNATLTLTLDADQIYLIDLQEYYIGGYYDIREGAEAMFTIRISSLADDSASVSDSEDMVEGEGEDAVETEEEPSTEG